MSNSVRHSLCVSLHIASSSPWFANIEAATLRQMCTATSSSSAQYESPQPADKQCVFMKKPQRQETKETKLRLLVLMIMWFGSRMADVMTLGGSGKWIQTLRMSISLCCDHRTSQS